MLSPTLHQSSTLVEHVGSCVRLRDRVTELMGEGELAGCPVSTVLHSVIMEFDVPSYRTNEAHNRHVEQMSDRQK